MPGKLKYQIDNLSSVVDRLEVLLTKYEKDRDRERQLKLNEQIQKAERLVTEIMSYTVKSSRPSPQ